MGRDERGQQRRILHGGDGARLVQQPIPSSFGQRRAEHIVDAGVPPEIERAVKPRNPGRHHHEREQQEQRDVDRPTPYRGRWGRAVAESHLRRSRRMLRKKLASTVWNPSAVSVVPGMTSRIVRA